MSRSFRFSPLRSHPPDALYRHGGVGGSGSTCGVDCLVLPRNDRHSVMWYLLCSEGQRGLWLRGIIGFLSIWFELWIGRRLMNDLTCITAAKQPKGGPRTYGESSHRVRIVRVSREGERTTLHDQLWQGSGDDRPLPFTQTTTTRDIRFIFSHALGLKLHPNYSQTGG